ncbi:PhaM family polyhydroxyalkanoate granule multifunctional regulatory protein [Pseudoduganella sp. GCM10020061]|uniref:PhaM family polyhydroxyalkanoate granule multifunctional regulatory protein n=1 Tax=Pseudoduganella sp. GCM10020061 TaxID=3317345 RepID=UPI003643A522
MQNPQMPNMPGAGSMSDSLEFVKNLWGNMGVPGIAAPTLSVDDLDKKIKDLKAVEIWLNVNTSMVRGSIQALEVQRATLTALKSMSEAMASQGNPFAAFAQQQQQQQQQEAAQPAAVAPEGEAGAAQGAPGAGASGDAAAAAAMGMANPALWWGMMQEQFQQALAQAVQANAAAAAPSPAQDGGADEKPSGGASRPPKPHAKRKAD